VPDAAQQNPREILDVIVRRKHFPPTNIGFVLEFAGSQPSSTRQSTASAVPVPVSALSGQSGHQPADNPAESVENDPQRKSQRSEYVTLPQRSLKDPAWVPRKVGANL
jgi:hypothetical protein